MNGLVFVNNVSLGLYATAVQRDGYRNAKLRTILGTLPDVLGPRGQLPDLQRTGPRDAKSYSSGTVLLARTIAIDSGRCRGQERGRGSTKASWGSPL